jgi:hypothetical protein
VAVIDTDPRNADDLSAFQSPEFWHGQGWAACSHVPAAAHLIVEIMGDDGTNEHVKTVYAQFGLALYLAQVLEHGLANALMCAELLPRRAGKPVPRKEWEAEFDTFMDQKFE